MQGWYWTDAGIRFLLSSLNFEETNAVTASCFLGNPDIDIGAYPVWNVHPGDEVAASNFPAGITVVSFVGGILTLSAPALATAATDAVIFPAAGVGLYGLALHLAQEAPAPSPKLAWSDIVECDFHGYSSDNEPFFVGPLTGRSADSAMLGNSFSFQPTDSLRPNTVVAACLTWGDFGSGPVQLVAISYAPAPIVMGTPADGFTFVPMVGLVADAQGETPNQWIT